MQFNREEPPSGPVNKPLLLSLLYKEFKQSQMLLLQIVYNQPTQFKQIV